jgi:hypothetical protein
MLIVSFASLFCTPCPLYSLIVCEQARINLLESIFIHLLGDSFRYRLGIQAPQTDLFYWCVLENKHELSRVLWTRVPYPVRTSLTATMLLRRMADEYESIDPMQGAWMIYPRCCQSLS